ncbi:S9 family peptidase [Alicyclobacillus fastidiosus]|uniref:S9 family peptidase n=1 Tax=Alicyclobacillus fastidiosus TaxID=392011 RepID=A0ABV5ABE9_9BACL|nr:S9 family peptidase [Alicyclobacillus fastidiosus]WEH10438.1 S9 family peptidase [Alicyclobacillus fastidiosus]
MKFERVDIEQFFRTYAISAFDVNEDETQIVFSTNLSGRYDVWSMSPTNPYPAPLTARGQLPHDIQFSPTGDYVLVAFDHDGDENAQLYAVSPKGGPLKPLRTAEGRRFMGTHISKDGKRLFYVSDKDNHSFLNGYVYDIDLDVETTLFEGSEGPSYIQAISDDETSFVTTTVFANTYNVTHLHQAGTVTSVTPDETAVHATYEVKFFGDLLYLTTNFGEEFIYFASFDPSTGTFEKRFSVERSDVTSFQLDKANHRAILTVSGSVEDELFAYDLESGVAARIDCPFTVITQVKVTNRGTIFVLGMRDTHPSNLFYLPPGANDWVPLTNNGIMGVSGEELSSAQTVSYRSFDGLEIEALLFPANPATANGYTVVWPHGGPQASERKFYRAFFQYLTYAGYQVFAPNFRGSSGYGATFVKMVEGDWGHGPRLDMVEGIEWLLQSGRAERDKLFLVGGSYGGYMTLLLHGRHAAYFQACVDIFGPSNLFTFVESVPDHWKPMMKQWLGDPAEDAERFVADSPITYLQGMTKPMLVIQGANDPRVVKAESDQIVAALRTQGTEIDYIVFDDEGHGFSKKENEIHAYRKAVEWLDRHRVAGAVEVASP